MKKNEIIVKIGVSGGISIDVMNGQGENCKEVTKDLELHLSDRKIESEAKKPEYFDPTSSLNLNLNQF